MNRFVFWCLVAITCTVVFFGVNNAASLSGTIMSTTGNVGGVVIGSAPKLVDGFREGIGAGNGNDSSIFKTFDQQRAQAQGRERAVAVERRERRENRLHAARNDR